MATYKQGIDGPVMGKIGQHVGSKWRGIYYLRGLATAISNPNTAKQRKIRARFACLVRLASSFKSALDKGFGKNGQLSVMSQSNIFVRKNWDYVTANNTDEVVVDYGSLQLSDGPLTGVNFGAADYGETQHLNISVAFTGNSDIEGTDADDEVYLFAYCPELNMSVFGAPVKRSNSSVTIAVPNLWDGQEVYLYGFTVACADNDKYPAGTCSRSVYCGSGEVQ